MELKPAENHLRILFIVREIECEKLDDEMMMS